MSSSFRFMSLSSGSAGNCYYLCGPSGALIIDAGVSVRRLRRCLSDVGESVDKVRAILVTHDHGDHIRHLGAFCKRLAMPVYATAVLHESLARHPYCAADIASCRRLLDESPSAGHIEIAGFMVKPFVVPHDATQTVGYHIYWPSSDGLVCDFTMMTDLGAVTSEAFAFARRSSTVVIESNYDDTMLFAGSYPLELKLRISQGRGHLSNTRCAEALEGISHDGLRNVFLCHLSENNNTPRLAWDESAASLGLNGDAKGGIRLQCLPRRSPSPLFEL